MKYYFLLTLLLVSYINCFAQKNKDLPTNLIGTWQSVSNGTSNESIEQWTMKNKNTMIGKIYKIFESDSILLDSMSIIKKNKQVFLYLKTYIDNQQIYTPYLLTRPEKSLFKFESAASQSHKVINYYFWSKDTIYLWTETPSSQETCFDLLLIKINNKKQDAR